MSRYRELMPKKGIFTTKDIMTVEEAAAVLIHMRFANSLINPINRLDVSRQPSLSPNTLTQFIEGSAPPENLHHIENAWEPGNQGLHSNRPKLSPTSCTPIAMEARAAREFAENVDIDTTASAKGKSLGQTLNDDFMDVGSTTQPRNKANNQEKGMASSTSGNAGKGLANQNQAEAIKFEEALKPKWRLCTYCGVPGHPIRRCPMVPCRRCHIIGHAPKHCPLLPCKYCNTSGQHAIGHCPVILAKTARNEHLQKLKEAARTAKKKPAQEEASLKRPLADNKEEYASLVSVNGQRGLTNETSVISPICDQPSHRT